MNGALDFRFVLLTIIVLSCLLVGSVIALTLGQSNQSWQSIGIIVSILGPTIAALVNYVLHQRTAAQLNNHLSNSSSQPPAPPAA